jgi:hypothetical protein
MKYLYNIFLWACGTLLTVLVLRERDVSCYPGHPLQPSFTDSEMVASANLPENTLTDIRQNLAQREYHITFDQNKQSLQSPNRRQNLRAYYKPGSLTVQKRVDSTGHNFRLELINEGIYADGERLFEVQPDAPTDNRADTLHIEHPGFTEEFINNEAGIRQNFFIPHAPAGTRKLQVRLLAKGLQVRESGDTALVFYEMNRGTGSEDKLTYNDLKCWDAEGKPLTAHLSASGNHISIDVDVEDAIYPVTIDPIIANGTPINANKTIEINQSYAWVGFSVSSAGDVNGDGYSDVIIGAPKYDNGQADEGAAFIFPGTATGLSLAGTTLQSNQPGAQMGYAVSSAGDINRDGYSDVLVGAPYFDGSVSNEGVVFVYKGSNTGISINNPYMIKLDQPEANLGISVAMGGDVNGDGFSDILAGAHQFYHNELNEGIGVLVYGAQNGLGAVTFLESNQPGAMMGFAVAGAGDTDGDGFSDVMVGARLYSHDQSMEGAAFIFKGSGQGVITANPLIIESNQVDARLGHALSSAGDVNGDGFADVAIGAYQYDKGSSNEGAVFIHYGSPTGIQSAPALTLESDQAEANFGISVACAGDVNGDGFADLIAGARYYSKGQNHEGAAWVYHGSKTGLDPIHASTLESNQADAWMGSAVASAGDVNGDGYSDVVVGAYAFDNGQKDEGSVFVWHGRADGVLKSTEKSITIDDNSERQILGRSVSAAGDVNGDGFGDIIVGAPGYMNDKGCVFIFHGSPNGIENVPTLKLEGSFLLGQFGFSSSGGGDVNGDGYDDVIIGSIKYSNGEEEEGAAFLYYGSPAGINEQSKVTIEGNKSEIYFGFSVSNNFDTNNDGYNDIVIGTKCSDVSGPLEGEAHVYLGSSNGINLASKLILKGDKPGAYLGNSVAGADLNEDGFDEIIVGAKNYDDGKGAVFIFNGAITGVNAVASTILKCDQEKAEMGNSVSSAGDVNGDGYGDIIVGSHLYDTNPNNVTVEKEGRAIIYYGSPAGINAQSASVLTSPIQYWEQRFGNAVAGAGDINGDGFSDVIIGADFMHLTGKNAFEGVAFVFNGSNTGINADNSFFVNGGQAAAFLGRSVAGAGDINGDGVSDVVIGVPSLDYENGIKDAGKAIIYYGNNGSKLQNNLRLYNSDLSTPINHTQFPQPDFGAGLFAKSFLGNNKGKLVWETKPLGQGFSKGSNNLITNSVQSSGDQTLYTGLGLAGTELKHVIAKQGPSTKIRTRVKYDPVLAMTGQMYGPWRYLPAYLQGNSTSPVPEDSAASALDVTELNNAATLPDVEHSTIIHPNPASDQLHVRLANPETIRKVRLLTASGEIVYQSAKLEKTIDLKGLPTGIYILQLLHSDGSPSSHRMVISR